MPIYLTHYTADGHRPTGPSMQTWHSDLSGAKSSMTGEPIHETARVVVYDNGDGTRLAFSDFPFRIEEITT